MHYIHGYWGYPLDFEVLWFPHFLCTPHKIIFLAQGVNSNQVMPNLGLASVQWKHGPWNHLIALETQTAPKLTLPISLLAMAGRHGIQIQIQIPKSLSWPDCGNGGGGGMCTAPSRLGWLKDRAWGNHAKGFRRMAQHG